MQTFLYKLVKIDHFNNVIELLPTFQIFNWLLPIFTVFPNFTIVTLGFYSFTAIKTVKNYFTAVNLPIYQFISSKNQIMSKKMFTTISIKLVSNWFSNLFQPELPDCRLKFRPMLEQYSLNRFQEKYYFDILNFFSSFKQWHLYVL
jgi:hypothetical protein